MRGLNREVIRFTKLPCATPGQAARSSAILIGRGVLAIVLSEGLTWLMASTGLVHNTLDVATIFLSGVLMVAGGYMLLAGTFHGVRAAYRLKRSGESLGFAWVSILVSPLALLAVYLILVVLTLVGADISHR